MNVDRQMPSENEQIGSSKGVDVANDLNSETIWNLLPPLALAAITVLLSVFVQKHLGLFLTSGSSIGFLVSAGAVAFLAGQLIVAFPSLARRRLATKADVASPDVLVLLRRAGLRSAVSICAIAVATFLYHVLPHYREPAYNAFMRWLDTLALFYVFCLIPYHFLSLLAESRSEQTTTPIPTPQEFIAVRCVQSIQTRSTNPLLRLWRHQRMRSLARSYLLRFFFIPLMFSSVMGLRAHLLLHIAFLEEPRFQAQFFWAWLLPLVSKLCLFLDVLVATAAYMLESRWLGNRIRSVDRNWFGWVVCLICYFPFRFYLDQMLPDSSATHADWPETRLGRRSYEIATVMLQLFWLLPTLCLGFRASNLTNRGIVTWGPYRWIRHPQYAFYMATLGLLMLRTFPDWSGIFTTLLMMLIYAARCATEERHLRRDVQYREYCQRTKYRIVPGVW